MDTIMFQPGTDSPYSQTDTPFIGEIDHQKEDHNYAENSSEKSQ